MKHGRVLVVGDCHLKLSRITDAELFISQLITEIQNGNYEHTIFLGDLFDTFAVVRTEILSLWNRLVSTVKTDTELVFIVGNHDYAGNNGGSHALEVFKGDVIVVDKPTRLLVGVEGIGVWLLPFMRDNNEFESVCRSLPEKSVLFCHQTFDGSQLENGFYAPEGANPDCVKHLSRVIVGHIHSSQSVGENIWYPGTPFQQSFSEAGQKKAIFHMSIGLDSMQYCQMEHTISLDMPAYEEVSLKSLTDRLPEPSLNTSFKIKGKGTPQEISTFKSSSQFKKLVDGSRRVVDDLSVIRDVTEMQDLIKSAANKTTAEKIQDFVNSKNWKSDKEALIGRARSFLTQ